MSATPGAGTLRGALKPRTHPVEGLDVIVSEWAVSVVIPTRDRVHLLAATLESVLAQRDVAIEVIVVDDGSDRSFRDVAGMADSRVRCLRRELSGGVATARNDGLAAARHPWVAFCDDDDLWAPDKLAAQLDALRDQPGALWSCVGVIEIDADLQLRGEGRPPPSGDVSAAVLSDNCIPGGGSGVLARTDLLRELGGFDAALSNIADYDMWIRLALAGSLASVERPLLAYRVHAGAMSRQLDDIGRELDVVNTKHAAARAARGTTTGKSMDLWIGDRHQRAGRRIPAARAFLRASTQLGAGRAVARALEGLLWPTAIRRRDGRRAAGLSVAWSTEAQEWLFPVETMSRPGPRVDEVRAARPAVRVRG